MQLITEWFRRNFSNPQVVILGLFLFGLFAVLMLLGGMLAPVLAAIVIAYLLEGLVRVLVARGLPRLVAVWLVFLGFLFFVAVVLFGLLPLVSTQATQLVQEIPAILGKGQATLHKLPALYPEVISVEQIDEIIVGIRSELTDWGQAALSPSSVVGATTVLVYLILLPLLLFFFLKDKELIIHWFREFIPEESQLVAQVWGDVDRQIGNYVRGKFWEIIIVWGVSYLTFLVLGLQYPMVLSVCLGLSVLVPFVGVAVVTVAGNVNNSSPGGFYSCRVGQRDSVLVCGRTIDHDGAVEGRDLSRWRIDRDSVTPGRVTGRSVQRHLSGAGGRYHAARSDLDSTIVRTAAHCVAGDRNIATRRRDRSAGVFDEDAILTSRTIDRTVERDCRRACGCDIGIGINGDPIVAAGAH